jgi:hypothetical protein
MDSDKKLAYIATAYIILVVLLIGGYVALVISYMVL